MDFLQLLRLAGMFGGGATPTPAPAPTPPVMPPVEPPVTAGIPTMGITPEQAEPPVQAGLPNTNAGMDMDIMRQYLQPQPTPASDALMEMYKNFPQMNHPGVGRKILAVMSAFSGQPGAPERVLHAPYYNQLNEYMAKMRPLEIASRAEDRAADNQRMMALGVMNRMIQEQRATDYGRGIDIKGEDLARKEREGQQRIALEEKKLKFRQWLADHPEHKYFWDKEGKLHGVDPRTNREEELDIEGYSRDEIERMIQGRQIAVENARSENRLELEQMKDWEIANIGGKAYRVQPGTGNLFKIADQPVEKPSSRGGAGGGARPMSWTQRLAQIKANYTKITTDNPEFDRYFKLNQVGLPVLRRNHPFSDADVKTLSKRMFTGVYDDTGKDWSYNMVEAPSPANVPTGNVAPPTGGTVVPAGSNKPQPATQPHTNPNVRGAGINQPPAVVWMKAPAKLGGAVGTVPVTDQKRLEGEGYVTIAKPAWAR